MSTLPKRSMVAATHAAAWSGSPALAANQATSPLMSAAAASRPAALRDEIITEAPDSAMADAMALPMPLDPPVTSATLPSSRSSMARHPTGGPRDARQPRALPNESKRPVPAARRLAFMNRLAHESSPYLRQHADNPVDWYPWGEEAFSRAREEDKPVLLSVGYSACHWCYVLGHESFDPPDVAAVRNELCGCVKGHREERPAVEA